MRLSGSSSSESYCSFDHANDSVNVPEIHRLLELVLLCAIVSRDFSMAGRILEFGRTRMYLLGATDEVCKFLLLLDTSSQDDYDQKGKRDYSHWKLLIENRMLLRFIEYTL